MRLVCILLLSLSAFIARSASRDTVVDLKMNFGALGDGMHNDHRAFEKASSFINQRGGNTTLIIPAGVYIVGRQLGYGTLLSLAYRPLVDGALNNPYYRLGIPALYITGCRNVRIEGRGASLKFEDELLLGGFEYDGQPLPLQDEQGKVLVPGPERLAFVGDGIYIENSEGIEVSGLELNGNLENIQVGGNISADGWQAGHTGVAMVNVKNVRLSRLRVHHFAVDGLQIRNTTTACADEKEDHRIQLSACSFTYNGRQGLSWTGGAGLIANDCDFSYTGKGWNRSLKGVLSTAPGAGVDIEPESDPHIGVYRLVKNGKFINCSFEHNTGAGIVADLLDEQTGRVAQNITFDSCSFWGSSFWSIWVSHPGFVFNRCNIYGSPVHSYSGTKPGMETVFRQCHFEDRSYNNTQGTNIPAYGAYLVEIADGIKTTFDRCTFISHGKPYYYLVSSRPGEQTAKFKVRDCRFINVSGSKQPGNCISEGVLFTGKNEYIGLPSE